MNITVFCPRCEGRFHVDESNRGKRLRCPNSLCRAVFEVPAETVPPTQSSAPPPAPLPPSSGSVADFVPLLTAEIAEPAVAAPLAKKTSETPKPRPKEPARKPVERQPALVEAFAPPPVRVYPVSTPVAPPPLDFPDDFPGDDTDAAASIAAESLHEIGPGTWEAPPVRALNGEAPPNGTPVTAAPKPLELPSAASRARRRALLAIGLLVIVGAAALASGWWKIEQARAGNEADRAQRAQELYNQSDFTGAAEAYGKLGRDFPDSADFKRYQFMAELSSVRGGADAARESAALKEALDNVIQFISFNEQEGLQQSLLKERHAGVWRTLHDLAKRLVSAADKQHDGEALEWARQAWATVEKKGIEPPTNVSQPEASRLMAAEFAQVAADMQEQARRQALLKALDDRIALPSATRVQEARAAVAAAAGMRHDPEVAKRLVQLVHAHRESVHYVPADPGVARPVPEEDTLPSLFVTPALQAAKAGPAGHGVFLSLARGVLYAFDPVRGNLRWARRVGVDTSVLPLHVPADPITPELVLVLSSDSRTVTAFVADTGSVVWQHALEEPCTGEPVLVGRSLLVPTVAGRIDEVETAGGRLLGHYEVGQRLTVGGARQEGTAFVYFPGDSFCVYVLDVAKRACAAVLYSNHPASSLRGVPILVRGRGAPTKDAEPAKGPAGWMLLCQAKGTSEIEVRPFELPIRDADQPPVEPILHIPGLSWFPPYHDAEKLALATDAGRLSLWGIRQKGNREDTLLFRLLTDDYLVGSTSGRAQVVHADADGYWVLSGGLLHRLRNVLRPQSGPDLLAGWPQPPAFGSPLHAAQHRSAPGATTLFLTTLGLDRPTCRSSAVDAASGRVQWQRQLGCVPLAAPVVVDGRVLLRDATGLLQVDPAQQAPDDGKMQTIDAFHVREAIGADERVRLVPAAKAAVQLTWSRRPGTTRLRIRHIPAAGASTTEMHELPAAPAGTPAVGADFMLLPLANGVAMRLDFGGTISAGPNWRAAGTEEQSPGHIVGLGDDEFILTDGDRGLMRVSWKGKAYQQRAATELGARIVTAPALLTSGSAPPRIVVADASDTLTVLDGERLQELRRWTLTGKITAGPFVRGKSIVCVVDRKTLTWIDPDRDESARGYGMVADVVGAPVLVEGMLIVADVSGRIMAFDPQTGEKLGGYTLRANTAPETAPVPFGPGRLLVPLTDGTLLIVPLAKLRQ